MCFKNNKHLLLSNSIQSIEIFWKWIALNLLQVTANEEWKRKLWHNKYPLMPRPLCTLKMKGKAFIETTNHSVFLLSTSSVIVPVCVVDEINNFYFIDVIFCFYELVFPLVYWLFIRIETFENSKNINAMYSHTR